MRRGVKHSETNVAFRDLPEDEKPRGKMTRNGGAKGLDAETLLAIMLKTGTVGCSVKTLAHKLLTAFGGAGRLVRFDLVQLLDEIKKYNKAHPGDRIIGMGEAKCMELAAAFEFVRMAYGQNPDDELPEEICLGDDAEKWFRRKLRYGDDREHFWVLPLDAAHKPLCEPLCVSSGLLNGTPAGAREVFATAVQMQAAAIIVAHNHPSGDPEPSKNDISLTEELIAASKILRIPLLDHIILGRERFVSLRDDGFVTVW